MNLNPLHQKVAINPPWTCKHIGITIIDASNLIYECQLCWSKGHIRVIANTKNRLIKIEDAAEEKKYVPT